MRNLKEIKAILAAIHCINFADNNNEDIHNLCEYAFGRIFNSTARLLTLSCLGKTKEQITKEVMEMLNLETDYKKYLQRLEEIKNEKNTNKT